MTTPIEDWIVKVLFDSSDVQKGVSRIEKIMSKLDKVNSRTTTKQTSRLDKQNNSLKKQNRLEAQRLALRKKIVQAEQLGISGLQKERGALGGTNPVKIRSQILELDKRITLERKKQAQIKAKQAADRVKTASAPKQKKEFALTEERQLKMANTIDSVVRRARRGLGATSDEFQMINRRAERLKMILGRVSSEKDLIRLNNQIRVLRERTTSATSAVRRMNQQMNAQKFAARGVNDSIKNLARSYLSIFTAIEGSRAFFQIGKEFESLQAVMLGASGTAEQAGMDFKFVREQALRLGIDLKEATRGFAKTGIAAKQAGFSGEQVKEIFLAVSEAGRAFNLTAQKQQLTFLALEQIISKGKVSMEELRRQLGEQIPGAFQIAAKSMGMTTAEFDKLVSSGKLASEDFIPKFVKELRKSVRETGALEAAMKKVAAEQGRFLTTIQIAVNKGFIAGKKSFAGGFRDLTMVVKDLTPAFKVLGKVGGALFKGLAFVIKLVSPVLDLFANALDRVTTSLANAIDLSKDTKDLSALETVFRVLARSGMIVGGVLLLISGGIEKIAKLLGAGEEGAKGFTADIIALTIGFVALSKLMKLIIKPFTMVAGLFSKATTKAALFAGSLTKIKSIASKLVKFLGKIGSRFLGPLGAVFVAKDISDAVGPSTKKQKEAMSLAGFGLPRDFRPPGSMAQSNSTIIDKKTIDISMEIKSDDPTKTADIVEERLQSIFKNSTPVL